MKRTTVFLEPEVEQELRLLAERKGVPAASLLRDALDRYLVEDRKGPVRPLRFLAAGRSGTTTTARRHETLLFRSLHPHGKASRRRGRPPNKA